jgi:5-hydroxyisourate hydrolase
MAGSLTTHVLDTFRGRAGSGMSVTLTRADDGVELAHVVTNADGRTEEPLLIGDAFQEGTYELHFDVGRYFADAPGAPDPPFLTTVTLRFSITSDEHYHVPLVTSPWSYTTYRGS